MRGSRSSPLFWADRRSSRNGRGIWLPICCPELCPPGNRRGQIPGRGLPGVPQSDGCEGILFGRNRRHKVRHPRIARRLPGEWGAAAVKFTSEAQYPRSTPATPTALSPPLPGENIPAKASARFPAPLSVPIRAAASLSKYPDDAASDRPAAALRT